MNTTKYYSRQFVILVILLLSGTGCTPSSGTAAVETRSALKATPAMTETPSPQNTPTEAPYHADLSCWQAKPLQAGNDIKGSLTLYVMNPNDGSLDYDWDISSFHAIPIEEHPALDWLDLPPGRNFVPTYTREKYVVKNVALKFPDKQPITLNIPQGSYLLTYLLNGQILVAPNPNLTTYNDKSEIYQKGIGYTATYYLFGPKTEKVTKHTVFLPRFTYLHRGGASWANIAYSPDGRYVLYRSELPDEYEKDGFSLLDLQTNQIKWTVPESNREMGMGDFRLLMPIWKSDASSLTYIWEDIRHGAQYFYNISLDGAIMRFPRFDFSSRGYILSSPQWSPDLRYMAFKVEKPNHPNEPEFYVWDDITKTLLSPCLPVDGLTSGYYFDWSPDGKYITLSLIYPDTSTPSGNPTFRTRNMILDIPNKVIYELPDSKTMYDYLKLSGDVFPYFARYWLNWEVP
jgi:hypothetical protein